MIPLKHEQTQKNNQPHFDIFWANPFQGTTHYSQMALNFHKIPHMDLNGPILHKTHVPEFLVSHVITRKSSLKV